jgi:hypothetical protein
MLATARSKATTFILRVSLGLNAAALALILVTALAAKTGHFHADIQIDQFSIGGGTAEHQALNGSLQKLASAVPASAITPVALKDGPRPAEKPRASK